MMTRIIVGLIGVPLIICLILFAPIWALALAVSVLSAGAAWEFMRCTAKTSSTRVKILIAIVAFLMPLNFGFELGFEEFFAITFVLFFALFCEVMLSFKNDEHISYNVVALAMVAGIMIPLFYSSLVRLDISGGAALVFLPFVVTFSSDSGAYFVGMSIGKNKLAPKLSPNKTIEGSIGGLVVTMLIIMAYGFGLTKFGYTVNYLALAIYGVVGSFFCQLGDLSFSAIKREANIKDYGKLIPGHGGMLDRFDSMVFTAPAIELLVLFLPAIGK